MYCHTVISRIQPPAGFEPRTSWTEVGTANHLATYTTEIPERGV